MLQYEQPDSCSVLLTRVKLGFTTVPVWVMIVMSSKNTVAGVIDSGSELEMVSLIAECLSEGNSNDT